MSALKAFLNKIHPMSGLFLKMLFVALAFLLMVVSSSYYVNDMLRNHMSREAKDVLRETKLAIETELTEPEATLAVISKSISKMISEGANAERIQEYMSEISAELNARSSGIMYDGVYGYFEVFGGRFLHFEEWEGGEDYDPTGRPWYLSAVEAKEKIAITPVYYNVRINNYIVTFVRRIFDEDNNPLGVVCLNVPLERIRDSVLNMRITDGGYGVLIDNNLDIIAHPHYGLIKRNVREISWDFAMLAGELESGEEISGRELDNYYGELSVVFAMQLDNNWILFIITPKGIYYQALEELKLNISILGTILAGVLILILFRIDRAKQIADEQNQKKSLLLAEMEKMREADERTQVMLDATPLSINFLDRSFQYIDCNQEAVKLFGLSSKQEYLDRIHELSPEYQPNGRPSRDLTRELMNKAFEEGYCRFEWIHQKADGEPIPSEITLVRVMHKEEYVIAGYIRDLREYKQMMEKIQQRDNQLEYALKEAQDASLAKSRFLATMSHEIRTPMNVILGVTESHLQTETLPGDIRDAFEKVYNSGDLLMHIINDILDLSKIEAGKFDLAPAKYEVASLINDAAQLNVARFEHKPIEFKIHVDENIPSLLFGDELRIKQILNNLLSNAFKYTDAGKVMLSFYIEDMPDDNSKVKLKLSVSDTGQGMSPEQVEKLFDEYSRFNLGSNRTTVGTGLGMAITRNLIKMMNGEIFIDSSPGKGSTFTVLVPQGKTGSGLLGKELTENFEKFHFSNPAQIKNRKIDREPMPYGKVLVVDDMKSNLDVAKLLLNPYGLKIDTAESGFEAIDIIERGIVYDMVFMDHMMPKMDGIEAVKRIRELNYRHPIFALTANAIAGQLEIFMSNGFDGYISKPIDIRQLNDVLNKHIRDKQPPRIIEAARMKASVKTETDNGPIMEIPGLETKHGLALCDDDPDIYIPILRSYVPNALEVIDRMRTVSEETLQDYAIDVHGLKGISATIGAEKIRSAAFHLEMRAKAGDLDGVLQSNDTLIENTENLLFNIQDWLAKLDSHNPKPMLSFPDRDLLVKLQKCCENYDMDGIDDAMEKLESSDYKKDAYLIPWLRGKIDSLDFPSAAKRLGEYNGEAEGRDSLPERV